MKQFILLHNSDDNTLVSINVERIVCAAFANPDHKSSVVHIYGEETNPIHVNEKPNDILKRIDGYCKFILVHSKTTNNDIIIPNGFVIKVREHPNGGSVITIDNPAFAAFEVNESVTSVTDMLNA